MTTVRTLLARALRLIRALAPGDEAGADELAVGVEAFNDLIASLHEARGPLAEMDVAADCIPGENQRVRIEAGDTVTVTLPNAVQAFGCADPDDYGFIPPVPPLPAGSAGPADGVRTRAPRDGARIEVVGARQGLYFYRADTNAWMSAYGLGLDDASPLNARYDDALAALLAERLIDVWPQALPPGPTLLRRFALARATLMTRPGTARGPVRGVFV
jgi:hypothetical protein